MISKYTNVSNIFHWQFHKKHGKTTTTEQTKKKKKPHTTKKSKQTDKNDHTSDFALELGEEKIGTKLPVMWCEQFHVLD